MGVINCNNHMMLGVDKAHQLISYFSHKFWVRGYWMEMLFHGHGIMKINA